MKHDESTDVRLLSKAVKINPSSKTITIPTNALIGNKRWGRIDFLCHYCGYHLIRLDGTILNNNPTDEREKRSKRDREFSKRKRDKLARQ